MSKRKLFGDRFEDGLGWAAGVWSPCGGSTDSRLAVFHATGSFGHRPCADSTYGGHPTTFGRGDHRVIDTLWAEAGNRVQWKRAA